MSETSKRVSKIDVSLGLAVWRKWTDMPLLVLAIGSLPLLLLELISERLNGTDRNFLFIVNVVIFIAFATDYFVELIICKQKFLYFKSEWSSLLIWIAQLLALLPALGFLGILRGVRALRILSTLSRVMGIGVSTRSEGKTLLRNMRHFLRLVSRALLGSPQLLHLPSQKTSAKRAESIHFLMRFGGLRAQ